MIIQLDKPREWKMTTKGVIEYSKLGHGSISKITSVNNDKIKLIAQRLGPADFGKLLKLYDEQQKTKDPEKAKEKLLEIGQFVNEHGIDFSDLEVNISTEQAISIIKIGLECGSGEKYTEDQIYEMIDKAQDNPDSDFTPYNLEQKAYNLVVDSQADNLDRELEKAVPLQKSQAQSNS